MAPNAHIYIATYTNKRIPSTSFSNQGRRQGGLWVTTATLTRGDSSLALQATTSSAVETAERVRQARTEARLAVFGGRGEKVGWGEGLKEG